MASYQKAISLRPGFAIALNNLGNCYAEVRSGCRLRRGADLTGTPAPA